MNIGVVFTVKPLNFGVMIARTSTLVLLLASQLSMMSQNIYVSPDSTFTFGDPTDLDLVVANVNVYNSTANRLNLKWVRFENIIPSGWKSLVCDRNSCKDSETNQDTFSLPTGPGLMWVHFQPYGIIGNGSVRILIYDPSDSSNTSTIGTWLAKVTPVGISTSASFSNAVSVYPNPAKSTVYFAGNLDKVEKVEIYSLLGEKVQSVNHVSARSGYDISELRKGLYFVRFISGAGEVIATRNLTKI